MPKRLGVLSLVLLLLAWSAAKAPAFLIRVVSGTTITQSINAVALSGTNYTSGASTGTVIGAVSVTMLPSLPTFSGTLSLSGAAAADFSLSSTTLPANLTTNSSTATCLTTTTYSINIVASQGGVNGSPFTQAETITCNPAGPQVPGPSLAMFATPPYTCSTNDYVSSTASGSGNGTSGSPWTLAQAAAASVSAGTCINLADGTYNLTGQVQITHGGNAATPSGYVVWRGTTITAGHPSTPNAILFAQSGLTGSTMLSVNAPYVWVDGLQINGNSATARLNCIGAGSDSSTNRNNTSIHHLWVTNSDIHDCGQAGAQFNDSEYFFFLNDSFPPSAYNPAFVVSSNLSLYQPFALCTGTNAPYSGCPFSTSGSFSGTYSRTTCSGAGCTYPASLAYDNYWCSTGTYAYCYDIVIAYNVIWGSYNPADSTDGEGLIFDNWDGTQGTCPISTCVYPQNALVMGNISYFNGSFGIQLGPNVASSTGEGTIVIANNTTWNNAVDSTTTGTSRAGIGNQQWNGAVYINNISKEVTITNADCINSPSVPLDCRIPYLSNQNSVKANTWLNNDCYPTNPYFGNCVALINGTLDTFPFTGTNHNENSDPLFINVTAGTFSTHTPGNSNFALCTGINTPVSGCGGASPAIGFGQAFSLWQQTGSIDDGACVSGLTSCP